jgi:digeranylgeranylglycerophospholipid reductase
MSNSADICIIGAGPAGIYLGWKLAKRNHSVIIIEKNSRQRTGSKMDQFHLETFVFDAYDIPPPMEDADEFITNFEFTAYYGPYSKHKKVMKYPITAMRFQFFIQRLIELAEADGVKFLFSCEYKLPIIKDNVLIGIRCNVNGQDQEHFAKLVVDASGSLAIVRRSLLNEIGVENFEIQDDEKMYVIQRVIRWLNPNEPHPGTGEYEGSISWLYYKTWVAPHFLPDGNIFGGGQPGGFHNTEKAAQLFLKEVSFPPYEVIEEHRATTAYRRSPFSIVGEGFFCIGDSACLSKSFSGEAIESSWNVSLYAIDLIDDLLNKGKNLNKANLWPINVQFFRNRGAKLAALLAQIPGAANTTKKDVEYLFKRDFIFSSRDFTAMWTKLELDMNLGRLIKIIFLFLWGLISRQFSRKALSTMLKYMKISGKIRKHYEKYPSEPEGFEAWAKRAGELWNPVEKMRYTLED